VRLLPAHVEGRLKALDRKPAHADSKVEVAERLSRRDCR
jgi:hypothetical protein